MEGAGGGEAQRDLDRTVQAVIKGRVGHEEADRIFSEPRAERDRARVDLDGLDATPYVIAVHPAPITRRLVAIERSIAGRGRSTALIDGEANPRR